MRKKCRPYVSKILHFYLDVKSYVKYRLYDIDSNILYSENNHSFLHEKKLKWVYDEGEQIIKLNGFNIYGFTKFNLVSLSDDELVLRIIK